MIKRQVLKLRGLVSEELVKKTIGLDELPRKC